MEDNFLIKLVVYNFILTLRVASQWTGYSSYFAGEKNQHLGNYFP